MKKSAKKTGIIPVLLSFTATLDCIASGSLTTKDLNRAIFCFGCARVWVVDNIPEKILDEQLPYQLEKITVETIATVRKHVLAAESNKRVVWRRSFLDNPIGGQNELSNTLQHCGLQPLNPNLPPVIEDSDFLKTAIERVNNISGLQRVNVIASPTSV
jgi:hypothetical protein